MNPPTSKAQLTELERASPLDTPELLDRILSFLDPYTLASSARLVCRRWSVAGRRYLKPVEYSWPEFFDEIEEFEQVLDMVPWMARLRWIASEQRSPAILASRKTEWAMLLNALEKAAGNPTLTDRKYSRTLRQEYHMLRDLLPTSAFDWSALPEHPLLAGPWARLRVFEVYGNVKSEWVMLVLPLMPSLTKLKLRTINGFSGDHIQIERIMRDCKQLEYLHISRVDGRERLPGPWVPVVPSSTAEKGFSFSSVSLNSLVLERVVFKQVVFETFLEHAPSLKELRIFDASIEIIFDSIGLAKLLRRLSLPLESFHISTADRTRDRELMPDLYRNSQSRTLWSSDFTIYNLRMNDHVHNNLSTLELVPKYGYAEYDNPYSALHNFLCSSPHLLHLKAPETCYPIAHMDLHGRLTKLLAQPRMKRPCKAYPKNVSFPPGIWQCRNLKTLHIRIFSPDRWNEVASEPVSEFARVAFGYIARVCPFLRDIALGNGPYRPNTAQGQRAIQPPLDLRLQGGFCLLSRLKHLERIEIGQFTERAVLSPQNFEWMQESGRTEGKKVERRKLLERTWKSLRLMSHVRKSVAAAADVYDKTGPGAHFDWTAVDPGLKEELRYLGWAVDVQNFFDELDKPAVKNGGGSGSGGEGGVECFPALRYSCICAPSGFYLPPEQDYKRFNVLPQENKNTM
ncbi:hypothetical protein KI688_012537 [Linnemannia hyalina]|uniref:F-box domain-containing protein n=1 Tax=Linnemannia hyalina TaxID=64524 RepID=A0A9P7XVE7_9FUNG|nr:hypothetical protein KI688_012537 [Linnemannia hyalina]